MATLPKVYLEHLAEISPDIIVAVDRSGNIIFYNDGARRTLGYSLDEVLGRHITLIYGDLEEARRLMAAMRSADQDMAMADRGSVPVAGHVERRGGTVRHRQKDRQTGGQQAGCAGRVAAVSGTTAKWHFCGEGTA